MMPNNGKIVIIDDSLEEATPIFNVLSKTGASYLYFDGSSANLPSTPISGVRVVFLDIELAQTVGATDKNKASTLASILRRVLGDHPSPYFIVFWTGHREVIPKIMKYLKKMSPIGYVELDKPSSDRLASGDFELAVIEGAINDSLMNCAAFQFFLKWELAISRSGAMLVDEIISIIPKALTTAQWSRECLKILASLYKTNTGKRQLDCGNEKHTIGASILLNKAHINVLDREVATVFKDSSFSLIDQPITPIVAAKLNAKLSIDQGVLDSYGNGAVHYAYSDRKMKKAIIESVFKSENVPKGLKCCSVFVTPPCDMAQEKFLKEGSGNLLRVLHGVIFPVSSQSELNRQLRSSKADSQFFVGPFLLNGKKTPLLMIIHFGALSSLWVDRSKSRKPEFVLKESLAADLQSKFASHANRLGNYLLPLS